jgi:hypothetical protein
VNRYRVHKRKVSQTKDIRYFWPLIEALEGRRLLLVFVVNYMGDEAATLRPSLSLAAPAAVSGLVPSVSGGGR